MGQPQRVLERMRGKCTGCVYFNPGGSHTGGIQRCSHPTEPVDPEDTMDSCNSDSLPYIYVHDPGGHEAYLVARVRLKLGVE